ncbi:ABC transporter ATP-binding protein [Trichothermofontia sp.]
MDAMRQDWEATTQAWETPPSGAEREVLLCVQGVSKKFCRSFKRSLFYGVQDIIAELTGRRSNTNQLRQGEFWALNDISFDLHRGESLGLVGVNGSGKTTLLRIISGLLRPDTGRVTVRGRVAPLIALGAGFNPILTGRENIYVNMAILGLSRQEIHDRFAAVVDFAELGDAIDAPVQSYSSGMAARLGFSCAIHTEPDILLIDEVLAVGDLRFRAKCERRLTELLRNGTSFVLVSHTFQAILNVCTTGIYLSQGKMVLTGSAKDVMDRYEADLASLDRPEGIRPSSVSMYASAYETGLRLLDIYFRNQSETIVEFPTTGQPLYICARCQANQAIANLSFFIAIYRILGEGGLALHMSSIYDGDTFAVAAGEHEIRAYLPYLSLMPGPYQLNVYFKDGPSYMLDACESFRFQVNPSSGLNRGIAYQPRTWEVKSL